MFGVCVGGVLVIAGVAALLHHRSCRHKLALGCALRRLGATAEQRTQLTALVERASSRLCGLKSKIEALRMELADALIAEPLETARLERLEAGLFETVGEFSQVLRETLTQVHQVLDARQRAKLGQWLREHRSCHGHCC